MKLTGRDGVRYTVPQTVRPAAMGRRRPLPVANPYWQIPLPCYVDGGAFFPPQKESRSWRPGEMSFTLTREALGESAQEVVFCVEEE